MHIHLFTSHARLFERNQHGDAVPMDLFPPKYELLLFQQCPRAVAVLASYPRSGNSLMRTLYEHTTLRVTGSDMQGGLAQHGESNQFVVMNLIKLLLDFLPNWFSFRSGW